MPLDQRQPPAWFPRCEWWIWALLCLLAQPARAARITGTIELSSGRQDELSEAVVYFEPRVPVQLVVPTTPLLMETRGKQFVPRVVAVPVGGKVRFPNADPILHNVFSVSGKNRFDLGLYRSGSGKSWRFDSAGVVRVFCNVHQSMVGYVLVLDTPFYTTADAAGRFKLDIAPDQAGTLHVWHSRAKSWSVDLPAGDRSVAVRLEVTRKRVPAHRNKHGRSYRRRRGRYGDRR